MTRKLFASMALATSVFVYASQGFAEPTYQWKDSEGRIIFGSKPPANVKNVEQVSGKSFSKYSSKKVIKAYEGYLAAANSTPPPATGSDSKDVKEQDLNVDPKPGTADAGAPDAQTKTSADDKPTVGDPAEWEAQEKTKTN